MAITPGTAEPLSCPHCDGSGTEPGRRLRATSEGYDGECRSCHGSGHARCFCGSDATALSLFDREPLCAPCADTDRTEQLEYLTGCGLSVETAHRWIAMMPALTRDEQRRFAGMSDEAYVAEIAGRCGQKEAA